MIEEYGWVHTEGNEDPKLGSCCNCGQQNNTVRNIVFIDRKSPEPGVGCWGCVVCGLPQLGVVAVLCDDCMTRSEGYPQQVCLGSPADNRRIPFSELSTEPFQHDVSKHAEDEAVAVPVTFPEDEDPWAFRPELAGGGIVDADAIIDRISSEIEREIKHRERHHRN